MKFNYLAALFLLPFIISCNDSTVGIKSEENLTVLNRCYDSLPLINKEVKHREFYSIRQKEFEMCLKKNNLNYAKTLDEISKADYKIEDKEKIYKILSSYYDLLSEDPNLEFPKSFSNIFSTEVISSIEKIENNLEYKVNGHYAKNLKHAFEKYKSVLESKDFIMLSSLTYPLIVNNMGGKNEFADYLKKNIFFDSDDANIALSKRSNVFDKIKFIQKYKETYYSSIPFNITTKWTFKNVKETLEQKLIGSLIAISDNNGKDWYFFIGNDSSKKILLRNKPQILSKLNIQPLKFINLGSDGKKSEGIEKNGKFIETRNNYKI